MNLIRVTFWRGDKKYTWFINDNWVPVIIFLLSFCFGLIFKKLRRRRLERLEKSKSLVNPRGGSFIDECTDPEKVYELIDPGLKIIVRDMLKETSVYKPLVISAEILFYAAIVRSQLGAKLSLLGAEVLVNNIKSLAFKSIVAVASGLAVVIGAPPLINVTGILFMLGLAVNLLMGDIKCNDLVLDIPVMERSNPHQSSKGIFYLDVPKDQLKDKVFIKDPEESELYVQQKVELESCSQEVDKSGFIHRKCYKEKKYVPLKERTKTLADLKKRDSTEVRSEAEPYIQRYEKRREQIKAARLKNKSDNNQNEL